MMITTGKATYEVPPQHRHAIEAHPAYRGDGCPAPRLVACKGGTCGITPWTGDGWGHVAEPLIDDPGFNAWIRSV
jgi:hypothetical protein